MAKLGQRVIARAIPHMIGNIKKNDLDIVAGLFEHGFPLDVKLDMQPMLIFAVAHDATAEMFNLLLQKGVDLQSTTMDGRTVCHWACRKARQDLVEILVAELQQRGL